MPDRFKCFTIDFISWLCLGPPDIFRDCAYPDLLICLFTFLVQEGGLQFHNYHLTLLGIRWISAKNICSACFLVLSSSNNGLKFYIWTYFFWNMFTNWPIFSDWWGHAGRFILQKKKRNPPRKWACLWQGTVWWKRRERKLLLGGAASCNPRKEPDLATGGFDLSEPIEFFFPHFAHRSLFSFDSYTLLHPWCFLCLKSWNDIACLFFFG